jgi:hypothetical protein
MCFERILNRSFHLISYSLRVILAISIVKMDKKKEKEVIPSD